MSDITIGATKDVTAVRTADHTTLTYVFGNSSKGREFLQKWANPEAPPKPDDRGRICVKVFPQDLADIQDDAARAGLSIESDEGEVPAQ
jgi:hypothetical protein